MSISYPNLKKIYEKLYADSLLSVRILLTHQRLILINHSNVVHIICVCVVTFINLFFYVVLFN